MTGKKMLSRILHSQLSYCESVNRWAYVYKCFHSSSCSLFPTVELALRYPICLNYAVFTEPGKGVDLRHF